jgi:hypothetical protein
MSQHTITRIANVLEAQFTDLVDMSDCGNRPAEDRRIQFLSRAVAALCIKNLANTDAATAGASVTDGFHDGGLDAIYFDHKTDTLFLVQSKWSQLGNKPLDPDGVGAFVDGIRNLLNERFERFSEKIRAKEAHVRPALYSARPVRIRLVTAHTATQPTPPFALRKLEDLVEELNDPVPIAKAEHFDQAGVYGLVTAESRPPKITLQIGLNDWGQIARPFLAYYGRVHTRDVSKWWTEHENALFSQNLRLFYFSSDVNDALRKTLETDPESFWYFNNGITIICDSITKTLAGATENKFGAFTCEGVSVVNGAQTVGTIGSVNGSVGKGSGHTDPDGPASWVQVRIISLENCPPEFARQITRAANLQNAVGNREFAAMDPRQHRLATEFALDKRTYAYKQGEADPKGNEGCSIVEATQALGCAHSSGLAVQVKREIGAVWADTEAPPYTDIFNDELSSTRVWRSVLIMRAVDDELQKLRSADYPRADMVAVHMNRIILHLVFQDPAVRAIHHDHAPESDLIAVVRGSARSTFAKVSAYLESQHPSEYLASLSKNLSKCEELAQSLLHPPQRAMVDAQGLDQGSLFGDWDGKAD